MMATESFLQAANLCRSHHCALERVRMDEPTNCSCWTRSVALVHTCMHVRANKQTRSHTQTHTRTYMCVYRQLLKRPTKLALVKGESYTVCSRQLADKPPPEKTELIGGVEVMAGLVARVTEEQMVVQDLAARLAKGAGSCGSWLGRLSRLDVAYEQRGVNMSDAEHCAQTALVRHKQCRPQLPFLVQNIVSKYQGLVLPAGVVPPPQYPVPAQQPGEEEGGVPEQPATTAGGADTEGEEGGAAAAAAAAQGGADGQQDAPTPAVKGDTGAAAAERGLKKLQG
eukprot:1157388-Pelagomonas_calceolata.AAC.1